MSIKLYGVIFGGLTVLFYLIGAFIGGTLNCADWNSFFKVCLAIVWLCHVWGITYALPYLKEFFNGTTK